MHGKSIFILLFTYGLHFARKRPGGEQALLVAFHRNRDEPGEVMIRAALRGLCRMATLRCEFMRGSQ